MFAPPPSLPVPASGVRRLVVGATALVSALGLVAEIGEYEFGLGEDIVEAFSLSYEANVPTWYASVLLFSCGALLGVVAHHAYRVASRDRHRWALLAAIFVYISLDEAVEIHEHAAYFDTGGVLYFSWVIPAAIVVALVGLAFLPFVRRLPPLTRRRFVIAGALYVGGALGMELPLGWWTERSGDQNLGYGLIDWVEESLELAGATYFFLSVWAHCEEGSEVEA